MKKKFKIKKGEVGIKVTVKIVDPYSKKSYKRHSDYLAYHAAKYLEIFCNPETQKALYGTR